MPSGASAERPAPRVVRSLRWRICAVFLASLLIFACAIQLLIVAPATQALGHLQLELATTRIQVGAEQHFRDIETRLHRARSLAGRLKLDDTNGFRALFAPFIDGDTSIAAIHLADADGRQLTLQHGSEQAVQGRTSASPQTGNAADAGHPDPASRLWFDAARQAPGGDNLIVWTPPQRLPATGDGGLSVVTRWTGADGKSRILAFDIPLAPLSQLSRNNPVGQAGSGILLTDGGQIVGLPRPAAARDALLEPLAHSNAGFLTHGYARWLESGRKSGETLPFNNAGEDWLTRFVPLQLGQQRWWVGGFARADDFTPAHLQDIAWALATLAALAAAAAVGLTRRIDAALAAVVDGSERLGRLDLTPGPALAAPWREIIELADSQERTRQHLRDTTQALARSQAELEQQINRRTDPPAEKSRAFADPLQFVHQLPDLPPNPVLYKDPDAGTLGGKRAGEEAIDTKREEPIGKAVLGLAHPPPAIRSAHHDADQKILAGGAKLQHEIRTQLHAIIGLAGLCLATGLEARQHDYVAKIKAAGTALLSVMNDMLDFSKIEAGRFEPEQTPFTLDRVLGNVIAFVANKAHEKGLELLIDIGPDVPQNLIGDPLRLGQVLTNLLGNAVKFAARGDIRLRITVAGSGPRLVTLRFEISDTGIGQGSGQIEGPFEAFSQADSSMARRFGGTGLSIARHLVGLMGGSPIWVDSRPGSGSRFGFSAPFELPTSATPLDAIVGAFGPAASPPPAPPGATRPLQGLRILVVEDNDINRQIACGLLESGGAIVSMAENGRLGVEALQRAGPEAFDAVLMDLQMPEMDGLEATHQIRQDPRFAALPIIALSAHALPEQRRKCIEAGMNDHVAKPIVPEALFDAILRHARRKPADNPAGALPTLPGLDVAGALHRMDNKPDTYLSLLRRFVASHADCAGHIDTALAAGQPKEAERLAHTLRGTAANLGADALRDAACALETTLRQGAGPAAAQALATRLGAELAALIAMLEGVLPPAPPAVDEGPAVLGQAEFDAAVTTLIQLMQSADGAASALFLQLHPDLVSRIGTEKTARIAEALQRYDYDKALNCLHAALDPGHPAHTGDTA